VLVDVPGAGLSAKVGEHEPNGPKRAVAIAERNVDSRIAEADDVGATIAAQIGEKARVLVDAPSSGLLPEVREHHLRRLECPVAIVPVR
jgi:hypothetical protein